MSGTSLKKRFRVTGVALVGGGAPGAAPGAAASDAITVTFHAVDENGNQLTGPAGASPSSTLNFAASDAEHFPVGGVIELAITKAA